MKYIRTKNGIYKDIDYISNPRIKIEKEYCINQADTIEELCDGYVMVDLDIESTPTLTTWKPPLQNGYEINKDYAIYGAIWTDKGLIYVAKMNDKGGLELL